MTTSKADPPLPRKRGTNLTQPLALKLELECVFTDSQEFVFIDSRETRICTAKGKTLTLPFSASSVSSANYQRCF